MTTKGLTLGRALERFNRLYPNEMEPKTQLKYLWGVDKAFAKETGQPEPKEYLTTTPLNTPLLVPKIHEELYWWALLARRGGCSEGQKQYYKDRYQYEKKAAVATWKAAKEGGIDIESFM